MGMLHRRRLSGHRVDREELTAEAERRLGDHALDHLDVFDEAAYSSADRIERDASGLVLGFKPAGAEAELEPPAAEHVKRGCLAGENCGMSQVLVEYRGSDPDSGSGQGRGRQCW